MKYSRLLEDYPILRDIQELADKEGYPTYVVGGCVRDWLLGKKVKDIDIVCVGDALRLAKGLATDLDTQITVFKHFGTAMISWQGLVIEFVRARKESYSVDSRKPTVTPGTLEDDLLRRDFTINTLAICVNYAKEGTLVDLCEGFDHLAKKIIETPLSPGKTFSDDPLRMLRAIRFACELSFTIRPDLEAAITQEASRIQIISQERITVAFNRILSSNEPDRGVFLLDKTGLLKFFLPELPLLKGRETIGVHAHKDNFKHTLQVVKQVSEVSNNLWLRWAALLHDIAKPETKQFNPDTGFSFHGHEELGAQKVVGIFRKMRLPRKEKMHYVRKLVRLHLRPIALTKEVTKAAIRRLIYEAGEDLDDLMKLCRADITSKNQHKAKQYLDNLDEVENKIKEVKKHDKIVNLQPVISGYTIMQTYGLKPSKQVGMIRKALKEAILEGAIANRYEELYTYMLKIGSEQGLEPIRSR